MTSSAAAEWQRRRRRAGDLFGLNKVVSVQIEISAEEYQAMQPVDAGRRLRRASRPLRGRKRRVPGRAERNLFKVEFPLGAGR